MVDMKVGKKDLSKINEDGEALNSGEMPFSEFNSPKDDVIVEEENENGSSHSKRYSSQPRNSRI